MTIEEKIEKNLLSNSQFKENYVNITKRWEETPNMSSFNWENYSWLVIKYCPQYFDPDKFNWKEDSDFVAEFCPQHFDTNKYNWKRDSKFIIEYCPQHFDSNKFNWEEHSWIIIKSCPQKLDINKANLENIIRNIPKYRDMSLKEIKQHAILNKL